MIHRLTSHRTGASLVEVLVGFGILGVGVTSVITLFPFSALTMGQALKDDRTATCAGMADGQLRDIHMRVIDGTASEQYFTALDNGTGAPPLLTTDPGPSYPVFIDPMGYYANGSMIKPMGDTPTAIPRVSLSVIDLSPNASTMAQRYCSLMDSLTYDEDGKVDTATNPNFREMRYNYAWMVQRPRNSDRFTVRLQVVVFNKRAHLYTPSSPETVMNNVDFSPGETSITVPNTTDVRKGTWVLDASIGPTADKDGVTRQLRHAEFYRVVSVTDTGTNYLLELHKPITRADGLTNPADTSFYAYKAQLVVMPAVADVFERPVLTDNRGQ